MRISTLFLWIEWQLHISLDGLERTFGRAVLEENGSLQSSWNQLLLRLAHMIPVPFENDTNLAVPKA